MPEIAAVGNEVLDARIVDSAEDFRRAIGRMVIDDDYIEIKISRFGRGRFARRRESSALDRGPE